MEQYRRKTWSFTYGEFFMVILFCLLIGTGLGMFYRIKQVEPQLTIAQAEIKRSHSLMVKDLTELDVRLTLIEKQIHGTRVKK
jgi:putative copper export protein